jgi:PKHD-type hydroxylase
MSKNELIIRWNLRSEKKKVFWYESAFTDEEVQSIKHLAEKIKLEEALVMQEEYKEVRKSSVAWIEANAVSEWLYKKLVDVVLHANSVNFNLNLVGFEMLQFTFYDSSVKGFYGTHVDTFSQPINYLNRKLSFSVQLSDPSEYDGGELFIEPLNEKIEAKKTKGSITFFESTERHQVMPVTRGSRYALVGWVSGPSIT